LGVAYTLDRVEIRWEYAHAASYQIQGSNDEDPMEWTTFASSEGREGLVVTTLPRGTQARWVRMFGQRRATMYGFSIWEFRVYADASAPQPEPPRPARAPQQGVLPMPAMIPIFPTNFRYLMRDRQARRMGPRRNSGNGEGPTAQPLGSENPGSDNPVLPTRPLPPPATQSSVLAPLLVSEPPEPAAAKAERTGPLAWLSSRLSCPTRRSAASEPPPPKLEGPLNTPYVPPPALEHLLGEIPCSICFELLKGSAITITTCGHIFHERCLRLADTPQCPQCRQDREAELRLDDR